MRSAGGRRLGVAGELEWLLFVVAALSFLGCGRFHAFGPAGCTALEWASVEGHLEVVRLLCEAGADKDKAEQEGATPLFIASQEGHTEAVHRVCEAGADKDKAKQNGVTP